jgi:hypothetical protein
MIAAPLELEQNINLTDNNDRHSPPTALGQTAISTTSGDPYKAIGKNFSRIAAI